MWNVEKDPHLDPTFGSVTLLDGIPDIDRLRRRLVRMVDRIPRLHQRVVPSLGRLAPPEWQDDPDFDIDYHLRHVALPAPGTRRRLFDLATLLVRDPFDRTRPLWEFVVVEGLEGDRAALVQKMHHTITDGEGGIRMSEQFIDIERDAPDIDEIELDARTTGAGRQHLRDGGRHDRPHVAPHARPRPTGRRGDGRHPRAPGPIGAGRARSRRDRPLGHPSAHRHRPRPLDVVDQSVAAAPARRHRRRPRRRRARPPRRSAAA